MNYYQPREMQDKNGQGTGLWHYTVKNDNRIWAIGNCADNCPGHADKEGAYEHYRQYLIDKARFHAPTVANPTLHKCEICGEWTDKIAIIDQTVHHFLCDTHCNRESLEQVVKVGDAISSY